MKKLKQMISAAAEKSQRRDCQFLSISLSFLWLYCLQTVWRRLIRYCSRSAWPENWVAGGWLPRNRMLQSQPRLWSWKSGIHSSQQQGADWGKHCSNFHCQLDTVWDQITGLQGIYITHYFYPFSITTTMTVQLNVTSLFSPEPRNWPSMSVMIIRRVSSRSPSFICTIYLCNILKWQQQSVSSHHSRKAHNQSPNWLFIVWFRVWGKTFQEIAWMPIFIET
jgi:hypothetical protein